MQPDPRAKPSASRRYTAWLNVNRRIVLGIAACTALVAGVIAATLPVHADFSYLLPEQSESVQHLRALEKRARVLGTAMIAVRCATPEPRAAAAKFIYDRLAELGPESVSSVTFDHHVARAYAWEHRWLLPSVQQLTDIRDNLGPYLQSLRRRGNPLVDDLEDAAPSPAQDANGRASVEALMTKLDQLEQERRDPGPWVSPDGTLQMMIVQTPFAAGNINRDVALLAQLDGIVAQVQAAHPEVQVGIAGDVVTSYEEHRAILAGMVQATCITLGLCLAALWAFYGSFASIVALAASLAVGTLCTFMCTRLTIGHLNVATAFLASIVLGNGINFGIMLMARFLEALRAGRRGEAAMELAIADTVHGTLAAAATAAVAYFSLVITAFRGFWHFGVIAGMGMLLCWACAYTVLPALLLVFDAQNRIRARPEPGVGRFLAALMPRRTGPVVVVAMVLGLVSSVIAYRFLRDDPYEANFKNLRSVSPALLTERAWMTAVDEAFGRGISGGFVIGVPKREDAWPLLKRLRAIDADRSEPNKLFSRLNGLDDYLPQDQEQKLQLLAAIRAQLDDATLETLPRQARAKLAALRPPANLVPMVDADVPEGMAWPFIETDGSRGKLLLAMSGWGYEVWNSHDIVRFADTMRSLDLGPDVLLGGSTFVFSDMLRFIERDGPRATFAAVVAASSVVLLVLGLNAEAVVTLVCSLLGVVMMLAAVALYGLRVNFLDFVALPITIGIGIDYAVNICARARALPRGPDRARQALATAGGAVCMSSYTTIVGYGSLLMSSNMGIRSFSAAAIVGEGTCLIAALLLAPALLDLLARRATVTPSR